MTPREYAEECGEVMAVSASIGTGTQGEFDFLKWAVSLAALESPPEFGDFHEASTTQYFGQELTDGPSSHTQAAYERELEIVAAMDPDLRDILFDGGCLKESDITVGTAFLEARARIMARTFDASRMTVEEYALHCRDIIITAPAMDNVDGLASHFLREWRKIIPPEIAEEYHQATLKVYEDFKENGEIDPASPNVLRLQEASVRVGTEFLDTLRLTGCIGQGQ